MTPNSFTFAFCWTDCPEQRMRRLLSSGLCLELNRDNENRIDLCLPQLNIGLFYCDHNSSFSTSFWIVNIHS